MRTARETFFQSVHRSELEKVVQSATFEAACQATLATIFEEGPQTFATPESSWQVGVYLAGARRALEVLSTIHLAEEPPKAPKAPTLNYSLK